MAGSSSDDLTEYHKANSVSVLNEIGTNREPFEWKRCNQNSYDFFFQVILHTFLRTSIQFLLGPVICSLYCLRVKVLGTFGFQDKDENEYEIWLPVFSENS